MATKFQIKRSTVSGVVPTTLDLSPGELAVNLADKKLFTANATSVFELGSNLTNLLVSGNLSVTALIANGSLGTAGQVLVSNGSGVYWTSASGTGTVTSINSGNGLEGGPITSVGTISILANNGVTANLSGLYVTQGTGIVVNSSGVHVNSAYISTLTSNFTNGQSISVNNFNFTGSFTANGLSGTAGQVLTTDGTTAYWSTVTSGNISSVVVSTQFTGNGTQNTFTVPGGYTPNAIEVYVNGVKQVPGLEVAVSSGNIISFITPPGNNYVVDVFGYRATSNVAANYLLRIGDTVEGNLTFSNTAGIIANGSIGTLGQVLVSNGSSMYWSSAGFTNGQSIAVNNFVVAGSFTANGGVGSSGQVLHSNGTSIYWESLPAITGVSPFTLITSNTTINVLTKNMIDTSGGNVYITLPATPNTGQAVVLADGGGDKYTQPVFVLRNGNSINGANSDLELDVPDFNVEIVYTGSTWKVFA